jgi:hypothetical protein
MTLRVWTYGLAWWGAWYLLTSERLIGGARETVWLKVFFDDDDGAIGVEYTVRPI